VDAESRRQVGRFQLGHFGGLGPFSSLQVEGNVTHYVHREVEAVLESGQRVIGTSFDQIMATGSAALSHEHTPAFLRTEGAVGVFVSYKDLLTGGAFPGVRDSRELNLAAFFHEEFEVGRYRLQLGARYDGHRVEPVDLSPIDTGDGLVEVETRTFGDVSASIAGLVRLGDGWTLGVSGARAFRSPSVKELFSAGPHLADFSYDVGNPELGTEVGLGMDLFLRLNRSRVNLEATVFRNRIRNFIHSRPTGRIDPRFQRFPLYVADGADAQFEGVDGRVEAEVLPGFVVDVTVSHVRAEYRESGEPLPMIPPAERSAGRPV
jgi:iron complex outermembrane recepter protein